MKPAVTVTYCTGCNWLMRAAWVAQELLQTFGADLAGVTIVPGEGGVFRVEIGGETLWDRKRDGGFPEIAELKRRLRDRAFPARSLGHSDRAGGADGP